MNQVPIIRKGAIKPYWSNGFGGGFLIGLFVFLVSLINKPLNTSLTFGVIAWSAIIFLFIGVGFTSEEYFKRKKKLKKLQSEQYSFLHENKFNIHENLYFEGEYRGFYFKVLPLSKWQKIKKDIEYDIIVAYYTFDIDPKDEEKEKRISGQYFLGELYFENHCVGFIPKDWRFTDFKENFEGLIDILRRENLKPLSKIEWEQTYGKT